MTDVTITAANVNLTPGRNYCFTKIENVLPSLRKKDVG